MNEIIDLIKAIGNGIKEGLLDMVNWNRDAREKPPEQEDKSWHKYYKYPEWRIWSTTETTAQIVVVLILLIIIRQGLGEFRYIPSESMEPTLVEGDKLCVEKITRLFKRHYVRGDVVIFYPPPAAKDGEEVIKNDPIRLFIRLTGLPFNELLKFLRLPEIEFLAQPEAFIKRIVAVPGDTIKIVKNQGVFINDEPLYEPYHYDSVNYLPEYNTEEIKIPDGYYYVLGDNRNYSYDSHYWGLLSEKRVIGRAAFLIYRSLDNKPSLQELPKK